MKTAATVLQRYTDDLAKDQRDIFARMESQANKKLLDEFWVLVADTTVEIKEKNVDLLSASTKKEETPKEQTQKEETIEPSRIIVP